MMKDKKFLKITAGMLLCSVLSYTMPIFAYTKDETVYSKLDAGGSEYLSIVSTHLKNDHQEDLLHDVSDLTGIKNVNGDETFTQDGNTLIWNANGNDIYYQGETDKKLPVECHVKYELNGKEIDAKNLAGKSGNLKITLEYANKEERTVTVNGKKVKMYVPFIVVCGTIIDNDTARNVTVSSGKVIDDGTKTTILGTAMPGLQKSLGLTNKELEIPNKVEISMDVTDFELGNIFSYVTSNILGKDDVKVFDRLDSIYAKINTLKNSSKKIEAGAKELATGTASLTAGTTQLKQGTSATYSGAKQISSIVNDAVKKLSSDKGDVLDEKTLKGIEAEAESASILTDKQKAEIKAHADSGIELQAKTIKAQAVASAKQVAEATALQTALTVAQTTARQTAIDTAITLNPALASNEAALKQIGDAAAAKATLTDKQKAEIKAQADAGVEAQRKTIEAQAVASAKQIAETTAVESAQAGATTAAKATASKVASAVASQVKEAAMNEVSSQMTALNSGLEKLVDGLSTLDKGASDLKNGAKKLQDGAETLSKGVQTFNKDGIEKICNYINGDMKNLTTRIEKLADLAESYKNFTMLDGKNDGEVKFIMMMDSIKKEDNIKQEVILNDKVEEKTDEEK